MIERDLDHQAPEADQDPEAEAEAQDIISQNQQILDPDQSIGIGTMKGEIDLDLVLRRIEIIQVRKTEEEEKHLAHLRALLEKEKRDLNLCL